MLRQRPRSFSVDSTTTPPNATPTGRQNTRCNTSATPPGRSNAKRPANATAAAPTGRRHRRPTSVDPQTPKYRPNAPVYRPHPAAMGASKKIVALGRDGKWLDILNVPRYRGWVDPYSNPERQTNREASGKDDMRFNNVSYATALMQLKGIKSFPKGHPMFQELLMDLKAELDERGMAWMGPQPFAGVAAALGKMELKDNPVVRNIMQLVEKKKTAYFLVIKGNDHDVANLMWACGKLNIPAPIFFATVGKNAHRLFATITNTHDISKCIWACGKLGIPSPGLFQQLDQEAHHVVTSGTSQTVSNCVWACAQLGVPCSRVFEFLNRDADRFFFLGESQHLTTVLESCAKLRVVPRDLVGLLEANPQWMLTRCKPRDMAECAWAMSVFGFQAPTFFAAVGDNFDRFVTDAAFFHVMLLCESMAVLDMMDGDYNEMFSPLWDFIVEHQQNDHPFSNESLCTMQFIQVAAEAAGVELTKPQEPYQRKIDTGTFPVDPSPTYVDTVSKLLIDLGIPHERHVSLSAPGLRRIDLAWVDRKMAIECHGPSHFVNVIGEGSPMIRMQTGPTMARRRILEHCGWTVLDLDCDEVTIAEGDMTRDWLLDQLMAAGIDWRPENGSPVATTHGSAQVEDDMDGSGAGGGV